MLVERTRLASFSGLMLPHLDYADTIWGGQRGLTSEMQQLQTFQYRFVKKIASGKLSSAEALVWCWNGLHFMKGALEIDVLQFRKQSRFLNFS